MLFPEYVDYTKHQKRQLEQVAEAFQKKIRDIEKSLTDNPIANATDPMKSFLSSQHVYQIDHPEIELFAPHVTIASMQMWHGHECYNGVVNYADLDKNAQMYAVRLIPISVYEDKVRVVAINSHGQIENSRLKGIEYLSTGELIIDPIYIEHMIKGKKYNVCKYIADAKKTLAKEKILQFF